MNKKSYIKPVVTQTIILPQCGMMVGSNDYEENTSDTSELPEGTELRAPRRPNHDVWSWDEEEESQEL